MQQPPPESPARRWVVLLAALLVMGLTARLGFWQLDRATQKLARQAQLDRASALPPLDNAGVRALPAGSDPRRAQVQGRWLTELQLWLDNRPLQQRSGFLLLTPLQLEGGAVLWVQRGWQAKGAGVHAAPPWPLSAAGTVTVSGRLAPEASRAYVLGTAASGPLQQNLDLAGSAQRLGQAPLPWVLWQTADCAPLVCDWPAPDAGVAKHHGYAAQWFALSALTVGLYVWFQLLRPRRRARAA